jgi:hypothetical protein
MSSRIAMAGGTLLLSLLALGARAQSAPCGGTTVFAAAGGVQNDRVDASVSPAQFQGRGGSLSAGGQLHSGSLCFALRAQIAAHSLSATSGSVGRERLIDGDVGITALRDLVATPSRSASLAIGAQWATTFSTTAHTYANSSQSVERFRLGVSSLGPAIRGRLALGSGEMIAQLSTPLVGLVEHSYLAIWSGSDGPDLRLATVGSLRGADGEIAYARPLPRGLDALFTYRVSALRLDDARPVRSLSQSFTLGVRIPLSARRR